MSDPFLSEIKVTAFSYPPKGWAACNGQFLPINQNQALFALLGTTYGGDGRVNFRLPDLRGRVPIHNSGNHLLGEVGGTESQTLLPTQIPAHTHSPGLAGTTADADLKTPAGTLPAHAAIEAYAGSGPFTTLHPQAATGLAGGSQAHTNMQPYLVLNFIIALQGIFPSQT
jgi:microcystin-dependent protein